MSEQPPVPREEESVAAPDGSVDRPHRDRPFTGDDAVDAALRVFDDAAGEALGAQLAAAEQAHRALQERLGS